MSVQLIQRSFWNIHKDMFTSKFRTPLARPCCWSQWHDDPAWVTIGKTFPSFVVGLPTFVSWKTRVLPEDMKCLLFKSQASKLCCSIPRFFPFNLKVSSQEWKIVCFQLRKMISDNHHPPNMPKISGLGIIWKARDCYDFIVTYSNFW